MNFEWDEARSATCFNEQGFDFANAAKALFDPDRLVRAGQRHSYGEDRFQLLGRIASRIFVVVYRCTTRWRKRRTPSASKQRRTAVAQ